MPRLRFIGERELDVEKRALIASAERTGAPDPRVVRGVRRYFARNTIRPLRIAVLRVSKGRIEGWIRAKNDRPRAARPSPRKTHPARLPAVRFHAMKDLTISCARSVCGPGLATHSCSQPSNTCSRQSPPAAL